MPLKNYHTAKTQNEEDSLLSRFEKNSKWVNPFLKQYFELKLKFPQSFLDPNEAKDFFTQKNEQNNGETILEIGSYYGEILKFLLRDFPHSSIIGMDITYKRIVKSYQSLSQLENHSSLQMLMANAKGLNRYFPENYLNGILVFFPDPWPKSKHEKHRLLNRDFINQVEKILKPGGFLWVKTDQKNYFDACFEALCASTLLENSQINAHVIQHQEYVSAFQQRFTQQGLAFYETCWRKKIN